MDPSGALRLGLYNPTTEKWLVHGNFAMPQPKPEWLHVAYTWDNSRLRGYVDGEQVLSWRFSDWKPVTASAPLMIGHPYHTNYNYYRGAIDELAIYDRSLSPAEVASLYRLGKSGQVLKK